MLRDYYSDLGRCAIVEAASNPTHGCRGLAALANKSGVSRTGLALRST
jgi:DNA-binding phage protein